MLDLKIINGCVIDGAGNSIEKVDVGIKDGKIHIVGDLKQIPSKQEFDV